MFPRVQTWASYIRILFVSMILAGVYYSLLRTILEIISGGGGFMERYVDFAIHLQIVSGKKSVCLGYCSSEGIILLDGVSGKISVRLGYCSSEGITLFR